jgi:hypothetical protein
LTLLDIRGGLCADPADAPLLLQFFSETGMLG